MTKVAPRRKKVKTIVLLSIISSGSSVVFVDFFLAEALSCDSLNLDFLLGGTFSAGGCWGKPRNTEYDWLLKETFPLFFHSATKVAEFWKF